MFTIKNKIEIENQLRIPIFNECANLHFGRHHYSYQLLHTHYHSWEDKEQAKLKFDQEQEQKNASSQKTLNEKYQHLLHSSHVRYKLHSNYEPHTPELKMELIQQARELAFSMFPLTSVGTLDYVTHQIYLRHLILKHPIQWPPYTLLLPMFQQYSKSNISLSSSKDPNWKRREKKRQKKQKQKPNPLYWFYHHPLFDKHLIKLVFQYTGFGLTSQARPLSTFPKHLFHWVTLFCHQYDDHSPIFWYFLTIYDYDGKSRKCYLITSHDFDDHTCYMNDSNFSGMLLDASSGELLDYVNWRLHNLLMFQEQHSEHSYHDKILVEQILKDIHLYQVSPDHIEDSRTPEAEQQHQKWLNELPSYEQERIQKDDQLYPYNFSFSVKDHVHLISQLLCKWEDNNQTGLTAIWMC